MLISKGGHKSLLAHSLWSLGFLAVRGDGARAETCRAWGPTQGPLLPKDGLVLRSCSELICFSTLAGLSGLQILLPFCHRRFYCEISQATNRRPIPHCYITVTFESVVTPAQEVKLVYINHYLLRSCYSLHKMESSH